MVEVAGGVTLSLVDSAIPTRSQCSLTVRQGGRASLLLFVGFVHLGDDLVEDVDFEPGDVEFLAAVLAGFIDIDNPLGNDAIRGVGCKLAVWAIETGQFSRLEFRTDELNPGVHAVGAAGQAR